MPSISSTYLLPAIILNPAFILHLINTFVSHWVPPSPTVSHSPHPFMESIGPLPGSTLYLDMHESDQLCWGYTVIMVLVQVFAFGRVSDNRVRRKSAKAARVEREKLRREKLEKLQLEKMRTDPPQECGNGNGLKRASENGNAKVILEGEESMTDMTETSEEEWFL
ncbi:hypothetical protein BGZ60DRAFT_468225 [Tricladium varicosporioides]|nr:hypothetical protein BGZ60DRAFT_468225 [Hymenoscyphus varicosporioides]